MNCVVEIPSALRPHCGGDRRVEIEAGTVRAVVSALDGKYPGFKTLLGEDIAVAIDGEILHEPWFESVPAGSELHFLPPVSGGH